MKLLVHDPSAARRAQVRAALDAAGHELVVADSLSVLTAALRTGGRPDAVLVSDAAAVPALREAAGSRPTWIAVWASSDSQADAALEGGADDVFLGVLDGGDLNRRLLLAQRKLTRDRDLRRLQYLSKNPVLRDPRTGALHPAALLSQVDHAAARTARVGQGVALLALEARALGFAPGVDLSPLLLQRALSALRPGDAAAFTAEQTLLIFFDGCAADEALALSRRVVDAVTRFPEAGSVAFEAAAGLAMQNPGSVARSGVQLLGEAGGALAQACLQGSRDVVVASTGGARCVPAQR